MKRSTSFLVRVALMAAALALAVVFVGRGADSPAEATTYNPDFSVSISDPTPLANADLVISFSVDAPDSFPNVKTKSSIQFIPRQWGVTPAPVGASAGTFNALTNLGLLGSTPCVMELPVPFDMTEASVDTSNTTSALDIGGDVHPGGLGYSGQFAEDPDTTQAPGDLNLTLVHFNADEKKDRSGSGFDNAATAYRDVDGDNYVSVGDIRLTERGGGWEPWGPAGSVVQPGDGDVTGLPHPLYAFTGNYRHDEGVAANNVMDPGENVYRDKDWNNKVSYNDLRMFEFGHLRWSSVVELFRLSGAVHHYPDFLNEMFPPEVVGEPLARQFGARNVVGTAVSLNIVTYRPGQLPGYPASLGYPNVVVLLDPVAPVDLLALTLTSDLCTPLSLVSTNLGVSEDNPTTAANEAGYMRLTNPGPATKDYKEYVFTLVSTSQPDADDDGIENMLDSCALDPNINDLDSRGMTQNWEIDLATDPDFDGIDAACDPEESPSPDLGRALLPFNPDEKAYGASCLDCYGQPSIYRDLTAPFGKVSAGDIRLYDHGSPRPLGVPVVAGDTDIGVSMGTIQEHPYSGAAYMHSENGAANGQYDAGEDIYLDRDFSDDVSLGDGRFLYNGVRKQWDDPDNTVFYLGQSPINPNLYSVDEDMDNYANRADNCPLTPNGIEMTGLQQQEVPGFTFYWAVTGALIGDDNQDDSDGDDIGDACDPDPYNITGHMHEVRLTQGVPVFKHGIKLDNLAGPKTLNSPGARTYSVPVSNLSGTDSEDIQVALRVFPGDCATVDGAVGENTAVVSVGPGGTGSASFTVNWEGCAAGPYILKADACDAGDPAPAGFFGVGACPGVDDGKVDTNLDDDAYLSKPVTVGSE
jgi:hypothetical protein